MNWRLPLIWTLLEAGGSRIPAVLRLLHQSEKLPVSLLYRRQRQFQERLLRHAYQYVPYYRRILQECGVITRSGEVALDRWSEIPILTKDLIRDHFEELQSSDPKRDRRRPYTNTSGGSTGEPLELIQDKVYRDWNIANKIYFKTFVGQKLGDREVRLWGSERDVLEGREHLSVRMRNWLYNRREVNAFHFTDSAWKTFLDLLERWQPGLVEAYVEAADAAADYITSQGASFPAPRAVITSAGTLYEPMRRGIEKTFRCPVLNRYGSREVGDMACSCAVQPGLHLSLFHHVFEVTDSDFRPMQPVGTGHVIVTPLHNYSMPLIRYQIGDLATTAGKSDSSCECGRTWPLLGAVRGREVSMFRTRAGTLVDGEYFTHLLYFRPWCRRFQVVQEDYDRIVFRVVLNAGLEKKFLADQGDIRAAVRAAMGPDCVVEFEPVKAIDPLPSGKRIFCISKVKFTT